MALALGLLTLLGCTKKPGPPSPEFAQASQIHSKLYGQKLDDAYLDPKMAEAEALLERVPPDSVDSPAARQLLERIRNGRKVKQEELVDRKQAILDATRPSGNPFPDRPADPQPTEPPPAPEAPDAGLPKPIPGMSMSEFTQRFSGCFESYQPLIVEGKGQRDTYVLKDIANCRDRFPGFEQLVLIVDESGSKLWQFGPKSDITVKVVDAGTPPPPPPPAPEDAGSQ